MAGRSFNKFDFFLSRRGSVSAIAREVANVLIESGYTVFVQDYDIPLSASLVEAMHEGIKNARDLIVLLTRDYETSPYTRKEFTSFEAMLLQNPVDHRVIILRCEEVRPVGLLADIVFQDLVAIDDQQERKRRIIAAVEGQSQALRPPPRPFVGVPPRIVDFVGRPDELDQLDALLVRQERVAVTQTPSRAAIFGLGGVGKTSLAIEYANRFRSLYAGVWWCPAETRSSLTTNLSAFAATLGAAATQEADVEKGAKAALRGLAEGRSTWLLVYDNVREPADIADLLPAAGARLLITSRFSDWSRWAHEVTLDVLPIDDAMALLQHRAGGSDDAGARLLAEALGRLPLALDHAAATCRRTQLPFADYAAKAIRMIQAAPRGTAYQRSVAATFDLALTEAVAECAGVELLMDYCGQCAPERIPMDLVAGAIGDDAVRIDALSVLAEVSLLKHDPFEDGTPAVTVHRLVQAVARARSEGQGTARAVVTRLRAQLAAIYPRDSQRDTASWQRCATLTPHLLAVCERQALDDAQSEECAELLNRAGEYLCGRAAYAEALPVFERALAVRERVFGLEHPKTAESLNGLAIAFENKGDVASALALYERALAICEKALGPNHPDTAKALNNLAVLLKDQGDFTRARPLYERSLAICEEVLGSKHPDTATNLNNLALLLQYQGDFAGARPLVERALLIYSEVLGSEHPDTAMTLHNLASLHHSQGYLASARPLYEHALSIREKVLGPDHPETALSLNSLAILLKDQGELTKARPLYERALAIREKTRGPEHPDTAANLNSLATLLKALGELDRARPLYERALAIREKVFGSEHPRTAGSLDQFGGLLHAQGDLKGARSLYERALAIKTKAHGLEHPEVATSLNNLATLLVDQGENARARTLAERSLAIREKVQGPNHPYTATGLSTLAGILSEQGHFAEARPLYQRALSICERVLGPEHPDTAKSLNNLGYLLQAQGDYTAARPFYERALAINEKVLGPEHPATVVSLGNIAKLHHDLGELAEARQLYERVLTIDEKALGPSHPTTIRHRRNYASLLLAGGDRAKALMLAEAALAEHEKAFGMDHAWTMDAAQTAIEALLAFGRSDEATAMRLRYGNRNKLGTQHPK